jgi:hypothetical protein
MDTMTLLKNNPMALVSDFDHDPIVRAAYEKFKQEGIARWHKKRAEEQKTAEERSLKKGERSQEKE